LDLEVFSLDITEISQSLPQRLDVRPGIGGAAGSRYVTDPRWLLRRDGKTKGVEQSAKGETRDFLTLGASNRKSKTCGEPRRTIENRKWYHRMILSALASTFGGIVRPICLAAFRLMKNSNFTGCSTGRSAGLVPLRILSTIDAARLKASSRSGP